MTTALEEDLKDRSAEAVQYLYDSYGRWIAFRRGKYVFDTAGKWVGWLPWEDGEVVDVEGEYLGTVFPGDRLYTVLAHRYRGYPGYPGYPGQPAFPGYPAFAGPSRLPPAAVDIEELKVLV
ncbi:4-fold beta flower protein [Candidatus Palauibacter sp.]|uniref:4-fold beta flower protein n=1 Tax=Candidatus Palauibacter sp. TaxID=3101350 RepID=UPI003D0A926C